MRRLISIAAAATLVSLLGVSPRAIAGGGADVAISATWDPVRVAVGETSTFTATVTNDGDEAAVDVVLTNVLPDGIDVSDVVPSIGTCDGVLVIVCTLGAISPGDAATVGFDVVPTESGDVTLAPAVTSLRDRNTANDTVTSVLRVVGAGGGACTIRGTSGAETLRGTSAADVICGRGGDDRLRGLAGDDVLRGGAGDDRLLGGSGRDRFAGGAGRDRCRARAGERARSC